MDFPMALLSRLYMDCCNCEISKSALASASGSQAQVEVMVCAETGVLPCEPIPVLSVVKIFQESKVRTNFTDDLKKAAQLAQREKAA